MSKKDLRDCKTCVHSDKGSRTGTEVCHECMWESKYKRQSCEDVISKQVVFEQISCWIGSGEYRYTNAIDYLCKRIKAIPPVTPQPKTGHWILIDKEKNKWRCTHCIELGKDDWWKLNEGTPQDNHMDFCPHCGAKMLEVEE